MEITNTKNEVPIQMIVIIFPFESTKPNKVLYQLFGNNVLV